tara:strand:+ start:220 stop:897 length:678 start_codon:yes stop_codon:yes gene_type:complete
MGFLRKVGRKIKKKVNKLFGSKFGKIIGGIGLAMMFFGGAKALFGKEGWWKNFSERIKDGNLFGRNNVADAATEAVNVLESPRIVDSSNVDLIPVDNVVDTPIKYNYNEKGKLIGSELGEVGKDAFVSSKGNILSSLKESEFIPNVAEGLTTSLALSAVQGEPEEPFISGGIAPQPAMEASQNAYLAEVQNQMPQYQGTNFQNLNQSLFYGTLSPDYLLTQTRMG